jgi:hypothetical protein
MSSSDNFTDNISDRLYIGNVKEAYQSTNKVNYMPPWFKHNARSTRLHYSEKILSNLSLFGWYDNILAHGFNLQSADDKRQNTRRSHLSCTQYCQDEAFLHPMSPQVNYMRETHVRGVCRRIKLTPLRDASEDVGIPNLGQLIRAQIAEDW